MPFSAGMMTSTLAHTALAKALQAIDVLTLGVGV